MAKSKRKSAEQMQAELRELTRPDPASGKPPVDFKKGGLRVALIVGVVWIICGALASWAHSAVPLIVAGVLTAITAGGAFWLVRYVNRQQALGAILQGADTAEGRAEALKKLETDFKKGDSQALLARAQLEMQEDPKKALATLETINLDKVMAPVAAQVRAMRAMIHLTLGETAEARQLADALDLGKQQDAKSRAMFATVAGEAWARTGQAKKAVETLELFNPEDPEFAELKPQMWRARAFAYAATNDTRAVSRALKRLAELNPQLLAMFVGTKKVHPLLEREAKQMVMRMGIVPRKMVRQRM
jgi:tetratricopeptide (TPR) repeat protein